MLSTPFATLLFSTTLAFVATLVAGCGAAQVANDGAAESEVITERSLNNEIIPESITKDEPESKPIDLALECKKYISEIMGKPPYLMKVEGQGDPGSMVRISYIRSDDGKKFIYECKTDGVSIVWRGVDIFSPGGWSWALAG